MYALFVNRAYRFLILVLLICAAAFAAAKPPFLKVFMATYKIDPNSTLGKERCLICHQPPGPPRRNAYGRQVGAALDAAHERMVTAEMLTGIEKKNDGDGVAFITKIKKGIPPADPMPKAAKPSKPAKKTKKPAKKKHVAFLPQGSSGLVLMCLAPLALIPGFLSKRA